MKVLTIFVLPLLVAAQGSTTTAPCSPIAPNNKGSITIHCSGISESQSDQLAAILNAALASRRDLAEVLSKVKEVLQAVNPNASKKTYFCNGDSKTVGPSASAALSVDLVVGDNQSFNHMLKLWNAKPMQKNELLAVCLQQIEEKPEWLTPLLFCGIAYISLGDMTNAKEMLGRFESQTGPAYEDGACKQMHAMLQKGLAGK